MRTQESNGRPQSTQQDGALTSIATNGEKFPGPKAMCPLAMPPAHHASPNLLNTTHASFKWGDVNHKDYGNDTPRRSRGQRSKPKSPGPKIASADKGSHFVENVISTADKTCKPSTISALLINKCDGPMLNNNIAEIAIIVSKDDHGISFENPGATRASCKPSRALGAAPGTLKSIRAFCRTRSMWSPFAKPSGAQNRRRLDCPELTGHHPARQRLPAAGSPYLTTFTKRECPHPACLLL